MSEAYAEAIAIAPVEDVILHTIELRHPSFVDDAGQPTAIRVVRDHADLSATLEADAPLDAGRAVQFIALPFDLTLPAESDGAPPEITLTIDGASQQIVRHLDAAVGSLSPIHCTYRPYLCLLYTSPSPRD